MVLVVLLLVLVLTRKSPEDWGSEVREPEEHDHKTFAGNYTFNISAAYPHDPGAFTQGLVYHNGSLYEGTGLKGHSNLREVNLTNGEVLRMVKLKWSHFGEGVTILDGKIYQLTWQSRTGLIYHLDNFTLIREFTYDTEGWGLTHDGRQLIMSDGTPKLYFLDPDTLEVTGSVNVSDNGEPVRNINELEYIDGTIFANIWQTDRIALISPESGNVTGWLDLTGIREDGGGGGMAVLNGIAHDADTGRIFVTGKLWPELFEIELVAVDRVKNS